MKISDEEYLGHFSHALLSEIKKTKPEDNEGLLRYNDVNLANIS